MPTVVATSRPVVTTRVLSSPLRDFTYYNSPFEYRGYGYPYRYGAYPYYNYPLYNAAYYSPYSYYTPASTTIVVAPPVSTTTYGTCKATTGVGVTANSCSPGKIAVSTADNGCMCADQTTGLSGCGNVLNGVCK